MELWIRSQDRIALTKINSIGIEYDKKLIGYGNVCVKLGNYSTKQRALEVLDEIQSILKPTIKINYEYDDSQPIMNGEWLKSLKEESKIEELSTYVYEMPKE